MAFVRDNDIQIGDICIFELIGKCQMLVHISGAGNNGLEYQSGKAASNDLTLATSAVNHPFLWDPLNLALSGHILEGLPICGYDEKKEVLVHIQAV